MVNFKICDVKNWYTNNTIYRLANILRGIGDQALKFGQLLEHNMRNIFL